MGRKSKYETHVQPFLEQISKWYEELDEKQIATEKLGLGISTWEKYKHEHPELVKALRDGKLNLIGELKMSLKKKAKGFYYEETKTSIREENGKQVKVVEKYKKYAQPDTGAIHLLLKNLDDTWRNDDKVTTELKKKQAEINERKVDQNEWS